MIIILHVLLICSGTTYGQVTFQKTYGGAGDDRSQAVIIDNDGNFVMTGYTTSVGSGVEDVWVVKTNNEGNLLWTRAYGGIARDMGMCIQQFKDSSYIVAGYTESFGAGSYDVYLLEIDLLGNLIWSKTFGGSGNEFARNVMVTQSNEIIITGYTNSFGAGANDIYLLKTDSVGGALWSKSYGQFANDFPYRAKRTADGGCILPCYRRNYVSQYQAYALKTDANGNFRIQ